MSIAEIKKEITQLPNAERARLAMWLWASVDENEVESPAWHAEELKRREEEIASGQAKFLTLNEVKERFGR
jgi:putative addiction module component (TIGR02574 family)